MNAESGHPLRIVVLITPHFNMAATMGFLDPFRAASYLDGVCHFRWQVASQAGGPCPASNGLTLDILRLADLHPARRDIVHYEHMDAFGEMFPECEASDALFVEHAIGRSDLRPSSDI